MKPVTNRLLPVLQASMEIRTATKVNGWLYFIKKLPIVGKRIPDRVYRWQTLKTVLAYITLPARFIGLWFGKALYVLLMAALPAILAAGEENLSAAYPYALHALVFLSLVSGTFQSRALLSSDADRYVCLRLMRLPPRPYLLAQYLVEIGKDAVGFLPVLTLGAFLLGGSPWDGLLCALEITALHAAGEAAHLAWFKLRGGAPGRLGGFKLLPIAAALVLAYLPLMLGRDWGIGRLAVSLPMALVCLAAGAAGFAYVWRYPRFTLVAMRTAKAEDLADLEEAKTKAHAADVQLKDKDLEQTDSRKFARLHGYRYLNAVFFERHKRLLYRPVLIRLAIIGAVFVLAVLLLLLAPEAGRKAAEKVPTLLPVMVFVLYLLTSVSDRTCRALFHNCDAALLRQGFYRKPSAILVNFRIRLGYMLGPNLLLGGAVAAGCVGFALLGGLAWPLADCIPFVLSLLLLGAFFSVHYLFLYYVFQPYTSDMTMKNPFYSLIRGIVYALCLICLNMDAAPARFSLIVLGATAAYIGMALVLIRRFAPKNFRVK